ncbi:hypothetical protein [Streptomyces griseorubiginosus]|uniref:hypothetical protein n=1 Tax=Streptomyces griseorubiginosus TaxID=67304 RepID=UPI002E819851|nr:hypothetical protein [Streptomyces griseorubiginosus]WUB45389.1 hypothetical protein OHN19_19355 [Streptomyces griseorubiginosus]WUB53907.1 hypothetical protein OG942_19355 [Streptomyces griseorubiginosus]
MEPAVPDLHWLEPEQLYFSVGPDCEIDRPLFQGDIFTDTILPVLPKRPPSPGEHPVEFVESVVMVVPHPCQCYHGDNLRKFITVAPVSQVLGYENFGADRTGKKDAFALPDLFAWRDGDEGVSYIADFGRIVSIPSSYLSLKSRIACLSHMGMGLLSKRFIAFQSRVPSRLGEVMAATQHQWNEAFLMQAWVQKNGKLKGFSTWMRSQVMIPSINETDPITPGDYVTSSTAELLQDILAD